MFVQVHLTWNSRQFSSDIVSEDEVNCSVFMQCAVYQQLRAAKGYSKVTVASLKHQCPLWWKKKDPCPGLNESVVGCVYVLRLNSYPNNGVFI